MVRQAFFASRTISTNMLSCLPAATSLAVTGQQMAIDVLLVGRNDRHASATHPNLAGRGRSEWILSIVAPRGRGDAGHVVGERRLRTDTDSSCERDSNDDSLIDG